MKAEPQLLGQQQLQAPSICMGATYLYAGGIFEEDTRPNLAKPMSQLVPAADGKPVCLTVNDKKLAAPLRVQLKWSGDGEQMRE